MAVESATNISQLVAASPAGADPISEGAPHIRVVKAAVKGTFPNISATVTPTHTELNYVAGVTSALQTQLTGKSDTSHLHTGVYAPVSHTHANLTPGTGLAGSVYNGGTAQTFSVSYGTGAGTAAQGNDSRLLKALPVSLRNAATTLNSTYADSAVYKDNATAYTYTLDNSVPVGTGFLIHNVGSAGAVTIAVSTNTLKWVSGDGLVPATGARTIGPSGCGSIIKIASGVFHIFGGGIS